jgi:phage N-6-adenine-methyltransferase
MNDEWETPDELFEVLDREFDFGFDLCANILNARCPDYTDDVAEYVDSYSGEEHGQYWMNPPYSRSKIGTCMKAAWDLAQMGKYVVCLVRDDPSARWYQNYVDGKATEVRRLKHRVKFKGAEDSYNFPCCVVVYRDNTEGTTEYKLWSWK